jgi:hypothetical protein
MLFLSYAEEDSESARRIAEWFRGRDIKVYLWEDPEQRGGRFLTQIERAMNRSDGFLALMSPGFIRSPLCHREAELAIHLEEDLQASDPDAKFIRVLLVENTPYGKADFLRSYDWLDVTSQEKMHRVLSGVADGFGRSRREESTVSGETQSELASPSFRNREEEVDKVLHGLTNTAGPHFWLVIAPPQLGKTWFMDHVAAKLLEAPVTWESRRVDVREYPEATRSNITLLLMELFGLARPAQTEQDISRFIAQTILQRRKPHLCLLDSAELLPESTAIELRSHLSEIYRRVKYAGRKDVWLAFIVASRRDDEWRGVTPYPRLTLLPLTQFRIDVVRDALRGLAQQMGLDHGSAELDQHAALVYRMSEGLPALLVLYLRWIQKEEWLDIERLENQEQFEALARDYIQELLSHDSLLPSNPERDDEPRRVLESAFRVLAPYRLFTQSHLRHHLERDRRFRAALEAVEWPIERLWNGISKTALLSRPLDEPWQETQAAIRRLLFRYFYKNSKQRVEAHQQARHFAEIWRDGQTGNEQVIGLIECLWHEAAALRLSQAADMEVALNRSARTFAEALRPSSLYTGAELRRSAARRMRNDEEFQETVSNIAGLFARLAQIVESTEEP